MSCCEDTSDFMYPMLADIYYPIIDQGSYGEIKKEWVFDRTISCNATDFGTEGKEEIKPEVFTQYKNRLLARSKTDIRISSRSTRESSTNILITNIRSANGELLFKETSGPRAGKGSIYEIATLEPFIGPFASIEYYKMVWRKTENQAVDN
jgi:hypothetical protein